jgi:hypothetical protein
MNLTNKWMNNTQYLAQVGHTLGGYGVIITAAYWSRSLLPLLIVTAVGVVAAAVKEFIYDKRFELPRQTNLDDITDFSFYMVGAGAAWLEVWAHHLSSG